MNILEINGLAVCLNKINYKGIQSEDRTNCTKLFRKLKEVIEEQQEVVKKLFLDYGAKENQGTFDYAHLTKEVREKLVKEYAENQEADLDVSSLKFNFLPQATLDKILESIEFNTAETILLEDFLLKKENSEENGTV